MHCNSLLLSVGTWLVCYIYMLNIYIHSQQKIQCLIEIKRTFQEKKIKCRVYFATMFLVIFWLVPERVNIFYVWFSFRNHGYIKQRQLHIRSKTSIRYIRELTQIFETIKTIYITYTAKSGTNNSCKINCRRT